MNAVDATEHYEIGANDPSPSFLAIVLDTNPHAWAGLDSALPFSTAIANLLVFINAHLACNYANDVAVVASHTQKAVWLYPSRDATHGPSDVTTIDDDGDVSMNGTSGLGAARNGTSSATHANDARSTTQANKYRPFRIVEEQVTRNLRRLLDSTHAADVESSASSTMLAGALTLALSYINRRAITWAEAHGGSRIDTTTATTTAAVDGGGLTAIGSARTTTDGSSGRGGNNAGEGGTLQARILIISVSSSTDSAHQYIPIMNSIFACQRLHIPIDICKLSGDAVFLQQASDATRGVYMALQDPRGLLQYLMMAFLPDQRSRRHLVLPTRVDVDFRAACFCHRRVVNVGFVCSICLSIFCEPPEDGVCLTCGTQLALGQYGAAKPALVARKKKKKVKVRAGANGALASGSATPVPGATPAP